MPTQTKPTPTPRPYAGAATIVHLRGCPASDEQAAWPMPAHVEVYRLDPPRMNDSNGAKPAARPMLASHCCKCGAINYAETT